MKVNNIYFLIFIGVQLGAQFIKIRAAYFKIDKTILKQPARILINCAPNWAPMKIKKKKKTPRCLVSGLSVHFKIKPNPITATNWKSERKILNVSSLSYPTLFPVGTGSNLPALLKENADDFD